MVDETRVLRLLRSVREDTGVLRQESTADEDRRADPMWLRGVKYAFVTAIEGVVDTAQHVCASAGWGPPRTNGDAVGLLGAHGVLPVATAAQVRRAVGFRNVLVHDYVDVDDSLVLARLADLGDLDAFVEAVVAWTTGRS